MSFPELLKIGKSSALDYTQIHQIVGNRCKLGFHDHISLPKRPTLAQILGKNDAVAILLHVEGRLNVAHWVCLVKATKRHPVQFFDPLGHSLKQLYSITREPPKILRALEGTTFHQNVNAVQRSAKNVRDCACHVAVRCVFWKWENREYVRFIKSHYGSTDDTVVTVCLLHLLEDHMLEPPAKKKYY